MRKYRKIGEVVMDVLSDQQVIVGDTDVRDVRIDHSFNDPFFVHPIEETACAAEFPSEHFRPVGEGDHRFSPPAFEGLTVDATRHSAVIDMG